MKQNETKLSPIISYKNYCNLCDVKCCKQRDYKNI